MSLQAIPLFLTGCVTTPAQFFHPAPETSEQKAVQVRHFETSDSSELLSASAAVLQDLGFHLEESGRELGFLRAAKERSARTYAQTSGRIVFQILTLGQLSAPIDLQQRIAATLVARPTDTSATRHEVRIMFYRVVWESASYMTGNPSREVIRDPLVYEQFFDRLSKAIFLEAFTL